MKVIGITGSSGSGKTTLSEIFSLMSDTAVIDADKVVKEMSAPKSEYLIAITNVFGKDLLLEDGNLNRKELANKIYSNKKDCESLNRLTFEYVVKEIISKMNYLKTQNLKFIIIDAPLLFESQLNNYCDYVICLIADKNLKIDRICQRDNLDRETAEKRLKIQKDDSYYIEKSDFVIENDNKCDLRKKIEDILFKIGD